MHGDAGKFCYPDVRSECDNPNKGRDGDRIIVNVGGYKHETHLSTLRNFPDTRLSWMAESPLTNASDDGNPVEYYFDRHPGVFVHILNYYRTGKLHCPSDVCGPLFEEELIFWGIDELQMEPCCWSTYTRHREARAFEKVFTVNPTNQEDELSDDGVGSTRQRRFWYSSYKRKMWDLLEKPYSSKGAQVLAMVSLVVIITSVVTFCLESIPELKEYKDVFHKLDNAYCILFTVDFVARILSCPNIKDFLHNTLTWCDIMSVLPFYTNVIWRVNYLNGFLVVRLFRIFRLFRFFRFMSGMQVIGHTLKASARELMLLVLILLIPMVIFSSLLFYTEKEFDGDPRFYSIPHSFWWAVITMTTVGYGDIYPQTALGRVIGTMCACSGVLIVALPVSVIGSNFSLFYSHAQAQLRLPRKRKQPVLVGAASALISTYEHEASTPSARDSDPNSNSDSEENVDGTSNHLLERANKKNVHEELEHESMELQCKTVTEKRKPLTARHPYGSTPILGVNQRQGPLKKKSNGLGKGLKAVGDIVVNIAAPAQRRMAISGVSLTHSPALRRSNSGKKRARSKCGDSLRKRTPTGTSTSENCKSEDFDENPFEQCIHNSSEQGEAGAADDKIGYDVSSEGNHLPNSDTCLVFKSRDNDKRAHFLISECEKDGGHDCQTNSDDTIKNGQSRSLGATSSSESHTNEHNKEGIPHEGLELRGLSSKGSRSDGDINMEGRQCKTSDIRHTKSSVPTHPELSDSSGLSPYVGRMFPGFSRRRSTTIDICNM